MTLRRVPTDIRFVTFDCYGTLIDWETGILDSISVWLRSHGIKAPRHDILDLYAEFEPQEQGSAYRTYREVLASVVDRFAKHYAVSISISERGLLAESLPFWKPFADTNEALISLSRKFKLAVISNVDDDLFARTRNLLPDVFADVITAQQVGAYKPSHLNFEVACDRLSCVPGELLHVAESLFHDISPCNDLGIPCVWINRRSKGMEAGATRTTGAVPHAILSSLDQLPDMLDA